MDFPVFNNNRNYKACKETVKYVLIKGKKKIDSNHSWGISDIGLGKDFKSLILNMPKELMESVGRELQKFKKMMHEEKETIKELEVIKRS